MRAAAERIQAIESIAELRFSRLYQTPPIGGPDGQEPFLNAAAAFTTDLSAGEVLARLQTIENDLGRVRRQRWGARRVDLDVVLHGPLIGGAAHLVVPHPRYTARRFVLMPACDVAPHFADPRFGWTLERLARHLEQGQPSLHLVGGEIETRRRIAELLRESGDVSVIAAPPIADNRNPGDGDEISGLKKSRRWVAMGSEPPTPDQADDPEAARLIARLYLSEGTPIWPAPHRLWNSGREYPEYSLEVTDLLWAAAEIRSALDSMRCPCEVVDDAEWLDGCESGR